MAAGFRGRIVTVSKGSLDAFLNVTWMPLDTSPVVSNDPTFANFTFGSLTMYPNTRSNTLEGRYVDGLSLTVDCDRCAHPRQHVFTLSAGTTYAVPETTAAQLTFSDPALLETASTCHNSRPGEPSGRHCYLGNCDCHTTEHNRNASIEPYTPEAFRVPAFVGNQFFCDAGAGPADDLSASGNTVSR